MQLQRNTTLPRVTLDCASGGTLTAGQRLKAECGEDELDDVVPRGKVWHYHVKIAITEEDAE